MSSMASSRAAAGTRGSASHPPETGGCILNVQVSHYAVNGFFGYQRSPLPSVPRVVRDILADGGLDVRIGTSRVSAEEIYLDADTLRGDFMPSLTDRALPADRPHDDR